MNCRYIGFSKFRTEILRGLNEELGKLYEKPINYLLDDNVDINFIREKLNDILLGRHREPTEIDLKINQILNEYDRHII